MGGGGVNSGPRKVYSSHQLISISYFSKESNKLVYMISRGLIDWFYVRVIEVWCLMPLKTIFQLYHCAVILVDETRVLGVSYQPDANH